MSIGVSGWKEGFENTVLCFAIGLVVALSLFVLHYANLVIQLFLGHGTEQVPHAI